MSGGLTEDEAQIVHELLSSIISQRVFPNIVETALFAIFTVLICISTCILISKGLRSRPNRILLALTLVMYTVSATLWAIDLKLMWNGLKVILPGSLSSIVPVDALDDINDNLLFAADMIPLVNFMLSDAVVLWRACAVWNLRKAVVCVAVCIFTCLIGCGLLYVLSASVSYFPSAPQSLASILNAPRNAIIHLALILLTVFVNVWATSMVALRAWIHRRNIRRYLQNRTAKSAAESTLMMLAESGIVYSICMVLLVPAFIISIPSGVLFPYWGRVMNQVSGMYPTLIIVLVALLKSYRDHHFSFLDKGPDATVTLAFSIRVPQSRTSVGISAFGTHPPLKLGIAQEGPYREDSGVDPLNDALSSQERDYVLEDRVQFTPNVE